MRNSRWFLLMAIVAIMGLLPLSTARAHGNPVVSVTPVTVPAGGEVTVTGTEMEEGEVFTISLEGLTSSVRLGEATVGGEGFAVTLVIPPDTPPGSYQLQAAADEETAIADLEVTPSTSAGEEHASGREPSAEPMVLARPRQPATMVVTAILGLLSLGIGLWLVRT